MRYKLIINNLTLKQAQRILAFCKNRELIEESDVKISRGPSA